MSHTLLVFALIKSETVSALFESLTDTDNTAVTENAENTVNKFCFNSVKADILIIKEFDKSLCHSQFHFYISFVIIFRVATSLLRSRSRLPRDARERTWA